MGHKFAANDLKPIEDIFAFEILYPFYIKGKNGEQYKIKNVLYNVKITIDILEGKLQEQRTDKSKGIITAKYKVNDLYSMVRVKTLSNTTTYLETKDKYLHKPLFIKD